jgi:1-deoxy-D-xylulose-5-phosphate synthase
VLCLDRAGFSAPDGATHHGLFDVNFLCGIPNLRLYSPESFDELRKTLKECENEDGVSAVRYPKGSQCGFPADAVICDGYKYKDFCKNGKTTPDCVVITYGKCATNASMAAKELKDCFTRVICVTRLKPFSVEAINDIIDGAKLLYLPEEGIRSGGFAMQITTEIKEKELFLGSKIKINAIDDKFIPHGSADSLYKLCGLDADSMKEDIESLLNT